MYAITVRSGFSSAHQLRGYKGKCENLHGHNWTVEVCITGEETDATGMLIDFKDVKKVLQEILGEIDHRVLNEVEPFDKINPTAENIAKYVFEKIKQRIAKKISLVKVCESENTSAKYFE